MLTLLLPGMVAGVRTYFIIIVIIIIIIVVVMMTIVNDDDFRIRLIVNDDDDDDDNDDDDCSRKMCRENKEIIGELRNEEKTTPNKANCYEISKQNFKRIGISKKLALLSQQSNLQGTRLPTSHQEYWTLSI